MDINVATLLSNFPEAISAPFQHTSSQLHSRVQQIVSQHQGCLNELLNARSQGLISQAQFDIELGREKRVLEAQLITQEIIIKSALQMSIDAAFSSLSVNITADPVAI